VANLVMTSGDRDPNFLAVVFCAVAGAAAAMYLQRYFIIVGTGFGGAWTMILGGMGPVGTLTSDALQPLRQQGGSVASVHPLMTFVYGSQPDLTNVPFALEGDLAALRMARQIIKRLGGDAFVVRKQDKARYHAWGTLVSPLLLSFMVAAEQVARATGIPAKDARKKMIPIAKQTLSNYASIGPARAFSGPLVRRCAVGVSI
jgi:predicted short-subunit dehydrogenase-like oxidoreductase (DUF2520 family)